MARFKDFGAGEQDKPAEPLSFKLHGEDFSCKPKMQGRILLDLVAASSAQDNPGEAAAIINKFFKLVLIAESYERFDALVQSDDRIVEVEQLSAIVAWLVEQYADRPTQPPAAS
jgi:hypothetical protein